MSGEAFLGMDVGTARTMADEMLTDATQLDSLIREVDAALGDLPWSGADADTFREQWKGTFRAELRRAAEHLHRQGSDLRVRVGRQTRASA